MITKSSQVKSTISDYFSSLSQSFETPTPTSLIFSLSRNSESSSMTVLLITLMSDVHIGTVFESVYVVKSSNAVIKKVPVINYDYPRFLLPYSENGREKGYR